MVHVEDAADGIVLALDKGRVGESYILGGHIGTLGELVRRVAELAGRRPPKLSLPSWLIRASLPLSPVLSKAMGLPPNVRESVKASDGSPTGRPTTKRDASSAIHRADSTRDYVRQLSEST